MLITLLVKGENEEQLSSLRSFSCSKIPDLVLDLHAGIQDGLLHPCADLLTPSGLWQAQDQVPRGRWGHRTGGHEGARGALPGEGVDGPSVAREKGLKVWAWLTEGPEPVAERAWHVRGWGGGGLWAKRLSAQGPCVQGLWSGVFSKQRGVKRA